MNIFAFLQGYMRKKKLGDFNADSLKKQHEADTKREKPKVKAL
jgi:hypothetical protein